MASARVRIPDGMEGLLRDDWTAAVKAAPLGKTDRLIAEKYFLDWIPQADIAAEINVDRSTVSRRLPKIIKRAQNTAETLKII